MRRLRLHLALALLTPAVLAAQVESQSAAPRGTYQQLVALFGDWRAFEDPPKLTKAMADGEEKLTVYRRVRDEIRRFVETLPAGLNRARRPAAG